ncbi:MAG: hypothetical protein COV67_14470 [Nitrospinae bacterium CG11_big_fil_rev_8_21_14_0_20_56_8]|nr:MAG: hypothetical protein COV67_14470 [Nitrospinae bacterium CG11_big_fil_rev_8_21_14_0_20_56_8]
MREEFRNKRVLVADNSPVMTRIIKNNLTTIGFEGDNILMAHDGNQAFMMVELADVDLVVSGLHMKVMNGLELLQKLRNGTDAKLKGLPFLIISAERKEYFRQELEQAGVNGYLNKPFTPDQLGKTLEEIFFPEPSGTLETGESGSAAPAPPGIPEVAPRVIQAFVESTLEALGQYMVCAEPEEPTDQYDADTFFSSLIDLCNPAHGLKLQLAMYFPKTVACNIYETIFGEVDMEQVCGVVQELVNIIGGIVKPKIAGYSRDILPLVHPEARGGDQPLEFDLGLPVAVMGEDRTVPIDNPQTHRFIVPFKVNGETITLTVFFQKI